MHNRSDTQHMEKEISKATLKRLPTYLSYLKALPEDASANISATALAAGLHMGEVQVRKDLALVSDGGRPKIGYNREHLIADIENFLGYGNSNDAVLIGAGKLGRALLGYSGFAEYGLTLSPRSTRTIRSLAQRRAASPSCSSRGSERSASAARSKSASSPFRQSTRRECVIC